MSVGSCTAVIVTGNGFGFVIDTTTSPSDTQRLRLIHLPQGNAAPTVPENLALPEGARAILLAHSKGARTSNASASIGGVNPASTPARPVTRRTFLRNGVVLTTGIASLTGLPIARLSFPGGIDAKIVEVCP